MHLIHYDVADGDEVWVVSQLLQQHTGRAVQQARLGCHLGLEADRVADDAASLTSSLGSHALCKGYGRDATRLRHDDLARAARALPALLLEEVLRHLR